MAKKKQKKGLIPKALLLTCIISGVATLVLRMLNHRLHIAELGEINGWVGTAFAISLVIIIGIVIADQVNSNG